MPTLHLGNIGTHGMVVVRSVTDGTGETLPLS